MVVDYSSAVNHCWEADAPLKTGSAYTEVIVGCMKQTGIYWSEHDLIVLQATAKTFVVDHLSNVAKVQRCRGAEVTWPDQHQHEPSV